MLLLILKMLLIVMMRLMIGSLKVIVESSMVECSELMNLVLMML